LEVAKTKNSFALLKKVSYYQYLPMATLDSNPYQQKRSLFSRATVVLVKMFGSWASVLVHTLIFISWIWLKLNLEILLVVVSLEAIYIGIFILMAENVEARDRERLRQLQRDRDMKIVKQDAKVDEMSLKELKSIKKQLSTIHNFLEEKKQ
jgi:uncharacterized membrane protein